MNKYLKVKDVALKTGLSERTIRRYCNTGYINDAYMNGKTWYIPETFKIKRNLISVLKDEKDHQIKGGIYNKIQIDFAYNSNHIEGSKLSKDETSLIYETHAIGNGVNKVDDVIEVVNHFRCFDYIIENYNLELNEKYIKELHKILKTNTFSSTSKEAVVGDFKKYQNFVSNIKTSSPTNVAKDIQSLLNKYNKKEKHTILDIIDFHAKFEKIHPFYDGNGRVGRLIIFKECLKSNITPFIINDKYKYEYYNGLMNYQTNKEKGYLIDTCLLMQDQMKNVLDYFEIDYDD